MPFDPQTTRYPYTERTDQHYLVVKKNDGKRFDKSYPYIDRSFWFRFKQFWTRILLVTIAFPVAKARLGLKVKGKKNIRANKALLKDGVISCANHVHLWDYIAVMYAAFPRRTNVLVWATNVRGENKKLIRMTGGIPIPDDDTGGTLAYYRAVRKLLNTAVGFIFTPKAVCGNITRRSVRSSAGSPCLPISVTSPFCRWRFPTESPAGSGVRFFIRSLSLR